ncbi:MAG: Clp1/GlmU family protein [Promethearchaeota archaeon]
MIKNLEKGHTILTRGPSRITLLEGKLEVFGKEILPKKENLSLDLSEFEDESVIIIPSAKSYPLFALENSKLEIYTSNENENLKLIKENSISSKWIKIKDLILEEIKKKEHKPLKIMVLGISSGKTTIIKYLANNFIKEGLKGGYLDSDLGQQIIYLPTTLNIGTIDDSIVSSEDISSEDTVFIGATYPKGNYKFIVSHSCKKLIEDYVKNHKETDFILLDTDGWVKQEAGVIYKNFFVKTVNPDVLIIFYDESIAELKSIEKDARLRKDRKIFLIEENNKYYYDKTKEERRFLRQSQFAKVLETYRKITIPLSANNIKFIKTDYDMESDSVFEREIDVKELTRLPYHYVIIALLDDNSNLIKIGLLFVINLEKDYILIFSDLTYKEQVKVKKILLGSLRLSTKGNHQGYLYL